MMRIAVIAVLAAIAFPAAAQAWVLPLERAHPNGGGGEWHYGQGVAPLNGLTIDNRLIDPASYGWAQVTIAWDSVTGDVLVGCRGAASTRESVRVWTRGHGWGLVQCAGTQPWRVVLRRIRPAVHLNEYVTFR